MRPKTHRELPPRMIARVRGAKVYFFYNGRDEMGKRTEIPLGQDLNEAKRRWAELDCKPAPIETGMMKYVFDRYLKEIACNKAPATRSDNRFSISSLRKVFDTAPIDAITPQHIAQYRDARSKVAPIRANRELALLSHVWNCAREWGYTSKENPTRGVRKNKESPRNYYAEAQVWDAVRSVSPEKLGSAMQLAYLTGQRPGDVLRMRFTDIKDGALEVDQGKTGKRLRIVLAGSELGKLIDKIKAQPIVGQTLVSNAKGQPVNRWTLRAWFDAARSAAAKAHPEIADKIRAFQFRDIRPKAASETSLEHASRLLGHSEQEITARVYRRVGEIVKPIR